MKILSLILFVTVFFCGCHHNAAIKTTDGHRHVGLVRSGDTENIYIEPVNATETIAIRRTDIQAISHPGKGAIIVGSLTIVASVGVALYGWLLLSLSQSSHVTTSNNDSNILAFFIGSTALAGVVGISTTVWGILANTASRAEAENGLPEFSVVPLISVDGDRGGGLSLRLTF